MRVNTTAESKRAARHAPHWPGRVRHAGRRFKHSLRWRLVALFLLLGLAMSAIFMIGLQAAASPRWREAVQPLLIDYIDRLAADIGSPPDIAKAQALVQRLPISVHIEGPSVNWDSHPQRQHVGDGSAHGFAKRWLERRSADGHLIRFGFALGDLGGSGSPRLVGLLTLLALLALTAAAFAYVRHLLRPLDDIRAGAERFGAGNFAQTIPLRHRDELGDLAQRINTMAQDLQRMLDAKRGLLLAISHELRSPLTRARLNVELLPETPDTEALRQALLRDMALMRELIVDLLESERLAAPHVALNREPVDLGALAHDVLAELSTEPNRLPPTLELAPGLPTLPLDRVRLRLLLRNLLDNALRHSAEAAQPPLLSLQTRPDGVLLQVRDYGPGVSDEQLPHLAEPFYRTDAARQRSTGGVGLGLYLSRLIALAHGASWSVRQARPGLEFSVVLPRDGAAPHSASTVHPS